MHYMLDVNCIDFCHPFISFPLSEITRFVSNAFFQRIVSICYLGLLLLILLSLELFLKFL